MISIKSDSTIGPIIPYNDSEYAGRLKALAAKVLHKEKLDAMIVSTDTNRYYLTGMECSNALIIISRGRPEFYTDFRYLEAAEKQLKFLKVGKIKKLAEFLPELSKGKKWKRVGYEGSISASTLQAFKDNLKDVKEWVDAEKHIKELRSIKSACELKTMRESVLTNDMIFERFLPYVKPGVTEWELRKKLAHLFIDHAHGEAFDPIVCAAENASRCHHKPGASKIRDNHGVLVDMGCRIGKYTSDMTRTFFFGKPPRKLLNIYKIVLDANLKAIAAIKPGRVCCDIDAVARKHITKHGYKKYFDHSLGHSLGLDIHELPGFGKDNKTVLKPGMAMTVEPGIYIPGLGGVRIEDVVVVTRKGCEVLTTTPKKLLIL